MSPQVINLRKKAGEKVSPKRPFNAKAVSSTVKTATLPPFKNYQPNISWEAPSFYYNPQKKYLVLIVGALATGGAGMLFFNKDTLTAIFLILSSLVLILYSSKRPEVSKITANQSGITIGDTTHYYRDIRSFWIHYQPEAIKELSLELKKWYVPYIKVSIEDKNPVAIRSLLVNFVPEREHENSLVDILVKKLKL